MKDTYWFRLLWKYMSINMCVVGIVTLPLRKVFDDMFSRFILDSNTFFTKDHNEDKNKTSMMPLHRLIINTVHFIFVINRIIMVSKYSYKTGYLHLFTFIIILYMLLIIANLIMRDWSVADEWFTTILVLWLAPLRLVQGVYVVIWINMLRKIKYNERLYCVSLDWYMHSVNGTITKAAN